MEILRRAAPCRNVPVTFTLGGMETLGSILLLILGCGLVLLVSWIRSHDKDREQCRQEALAQFEQWQQSAVAAQLHLDPTNCEIVQESESVGRTRGSGPIYSYTLTRFLRNPDGEYFMFKSTPSGPYVKFVAVDVAKAVLKEKFVEPNAA